MGSELEFGEGHVLVEPGEPVYGLFLIRSGVVLVQTPIEEYERGPGHVVGEWEKLDGSEDVRVTAQSDLRLVAVSRSDYEAALTG
ncbi:MAG: hypothetical protein H0X39_14640 [Actinobacteria bacterium]|nr:hypothetical protein [Actinomycetota bacterium]